MSIENVLAGVAVRDLKLSIAWYGDLLERAPDAQPMPEVAEWNFANGGWMQVFEDVERAGSSSVTLVEDDVDARVEQLEARGISIQDQSESAYVKTAIVRDPDGNQIVFAESLSPRNPSALP